MGKSGVEWDGVILILTIDKVVKLSTSTVSFHRASLYTVQCSTTVELSGWEWSDTNIDINFHEVKLAAPSVNKFHCLSRSRYA